MILVNILAKTLFVNPTTESCTRPSKSDPRPLHLGQLPP